VRSPCAPQRHLNPRLSAETPGGASARALLARRRPGCLSLFVILGLGLGLGRAPSAQAYIRARTEVTDVPYFWHDPRVILEMAVPPDGIGISATDLRTASTAALRAWSKPALSCTEVALQVAPDMVEDQIAKRDGHDRIILRTGAWCRDPTAMTDCHDADLVALTTWFVRNAPGAPDDGQILEADIEVNTVDFSFAMIPNGMVSARDYLDHYDLTSALTHEAGHFLGLAHDCRQSGEIVFVDQHGVAAPACSSTAAQTPAILDDTMYPVLNPVDVKQRTLAPDDTQAACDIYPLGSLPNDTWTGSIGCAVAPPDGHLAGRRERLAVALTGGPLALAAVLRRRRRRHRTPVVQLATLRNDWGTSRPPRAPPMNLPR
jgi:hypothetical protein